MTPRPRSRWRRALRWFLVAMSVLVGLVLVALLLLQTDYARDKVRGTIERQLGARLRGEVAIGRLSGNLLTGATLHEVVITDQTGQPAISIDRLYLDYRLAPLLDNHFHADELSIEGLGVIARRGEDGRFLLADLLIPPEPDGGAPWTVTMDEISVTESSVAVEVSPGQFETLEQAELLAQLMVRTGGTEVSLDRLSGLWASRQVPLAASGHLQIDDAGLLLLEDLVLSAAESVVEVPYLRRDGDDLGGMFIARIRAEDLRSILGESPVTADLLLSGFAHKHGPAEPWRATLFGGGAGASLAAMLTVRDPAAALAAEPAPEPRVEGVVLWSGVRPADIVRGGPVADLSGSAWVELSGEGLGDARGRVVARTSGSIGELALDEGRLDARIEDGRLRAEAAVRSPLARVDAEAVVDLPAEAAAWRQAVVESSRVTADVDDLGAIERALGRPVTLRGPARIRARVTGPLGRLAATAEVTSPRIERGDLRLEGVRAELAVRGLPERPRGSADVRARRVVRAGRDLGPGRIRARSSGGRQVALDFDVGGRGDAPGIRGSARIDLLGERPAIDGARIQLDEIAIDTGELVWRGAGGELTVSGGGRRIEGDIELRSRAGRAQLAVDLTRRGEVLRGPVSFDLELDLGPLFEGLGEEEPPATGRVAARGELQLPAGPGRVEAEVRRVQLRAEPDREVPRLDGALVAELADRRLAATVDLTAGDLGGVKAELVGRTPARLLDADAWRRLRTDSITSLSVDAEEVALAGLAELAGFEPLRAGELALHVEAGQGLRSGRMTLEVTGARLSAELATDRPELVDPRPGAERERERRQRGERGGDPTNATGPAGQVLAFDARAEGAFGDGELTLAVDADFGDRGVIDLDLAATAPPRPLDLDSWRRSGLDAIRFAHVEARRVELGQFEALLPPSDPGEPITPLDLGGRVDVELSSGPGGELLALRVALDRVRARRLAVPLSGELRGVIGARRTGANLELRHGEAPIVRGELSVPAGTALLARGLDPDRLGRQLRGTPITAELVIPRQPAARLMASVASIGEVIDVGGVVEGSARLRGTVDDPRLTFQLRAPGLALEGVRFDRFELDGRYAASGWSASARARHAKGGSLDLTARAGGPEGAPMSIDLKARHLNLAFLRPFVIKPGGGITHIGGKLFADLSMTGTAARPRIDGTIKLREVEARLPDFLRPLHSGRIDITFDRSRMTLVGKAQSRPGRIRIEGKASLTRPESATFSLRARASDLPVMAGTQLTSVDGYVRVSGRMRDRLLIVDAVIERGLILRLPNGREGPLHDTGELDDVVFVDAAGVAAREAAEKASSAALGIRLRVRTDDTVTVRGDVIYAEAGMDLEVTSIGGVTAVNGTVETRRGWVEINSRRYEIQRGTVAFAGEMPPDPRLDVRVAHRFSSATVFIDVVGPLSDPQVSFASDSARYDQSQLLGLVLSGEGGPGEPSSAGATATGAAASLLAGQVTSAIKQSGLPIDALRIGTESGSEQVSNVMVGKWITDRLFVAYRRRFEADVSENDNEGVFQHYFARDWMWEGVAGDRGTASVDLLWVVPF